MKLAVGTIPFGLRNPYRDRGKVPFQEAAAIMAYAQQAGMETIDTAPDYGDSETIIGHIKEGYAFPRIVTKTPAFPEEWIGPEPIGRLEAVFRRSLRAMRRTPVYAVVVQRGEDILKPGGERIVGRLQAWKEEGLTEKIGYSVVGGADELERLLERFKPDLVQLPANALDRRLLASGHLRQLRAAGIEIQSRSAFLHGLLLRDPSLLPSGLERLRYTTLFRSADCRVACRLDAAGLDSSPRSALLRQKHPGNRRGHRRLPQPAADSGGPSGVRGGTGKLGGDRGHSSAAGFGFNEGLEGIGSEIKSFPSAEIALCT